MALEAATTINQLREDYPTGLDPKSQGDDHIRLIKASLKRTFPAVTGVVTVSHEQINRVADLTQYVQPGMVVMWPYSVGTIPAGWRVCNGVGEVTGGRLVPNLLDRFLVGAGDSYAVGAVGGSANSVVVAHNHTGSTNAAGSHAHSVNVGVATTNNSTSGNGGDNMRAGSTGPAGEHAHSFTTTTVGSSGVGANLPPYYAILYIIKV